jgi:hypothetical protein
MEYLRRPRVSHHSKRDGNDQIGHAEQCPCNRSTSSPRVLEATRNPRRRCSDEDVSQSSGQCPERRHATLQHENQENESLEPPQAESNEVGLIAEQTTERPRDAQEQRQCEEHDDQIRSYRRHSRSRRGLEESAPRENGRGGSPNGQHDSARNCHARVAARGALAPEHGKQRCDDESRGEQDGDGERR